MNNKILKSFSLALCCLLLVFSLTACGSKYEVSMGIGDGSKANDSVNCNYVLNDSFTDDYILKGFFSYESEADLTGKFIFSISFDERFSNSFHENVLFEFSGEQLKEAQNGKLSFEINLGTLSNTFEKTDSPKTFAFHFHREGAKPTDIMSWSESSYTYAFDGKKVKLDK